MKVSDNFAGHLINVYFSANVDMEKLLFKKVLRQRTIRVAAQAYRQNIEVMRCHRRHPADQEVDQFSTAA